MKSCGAKFAHTVCNRKNGLHMILDINVHLCPCYGLRSLPSHFICSETQLSQEMKSCGAKFVRCECHVRDKLLEKYLGTAFGFDLQRSGRRIRVRLPPNPCPRESLFGVFKTPEKWRTSNSQGKERASPKRFECNSIGSLPKEARSIQRGLKTFG